MGKSKFTVIERFWRAVEKSPDPGGCWIWTSYRQWRRGYGTFWDGKKYGKAHRFAYAMLVGPIPDGMAVLHRCDNPPCVNPDHLFLGTQTDNVLDMERKGRARHHRGERNGNARLTAEDVQAIRLAFAASKSTSSRGVRFRWDGRDATLAAQYGVCTETIRRVVRGDFWSHPN